MKFHNCGPNLIETLKIWAFRAGSVWFSHDLAKLAKNSTIDLIILKIVISNKDIQISNYNFENSGI